MIIIKIGGSEGTDFGAICADVAERIAAGEEPQLPWQAMSPRCSSRRSRKNDVVPKGLVLERAAAYGESLREVEDQ